MDIQEAIRSRRTIRVFKNTPLDDNLVNSILEAGRLAPSWGNSQTWRWVVVRDEKTRLAIAEQAPRVGNRGIQALKTAPVIIVACAELYNAGVREGQPVTDKGGYWYMFDAALALENMVLTAQSLGLGTLFVGGMNARKVEELISVPEGFAVVILMVLGYPAEQPEARPRKELAEIVFQNRFGIK